MEGKRGQLIPLTDRQKHARLISKAVAAGARQDKACEVIGLSTRTLHRWRIDGDIGEDKRPKTIRPEPQNKLSVRERQAVIDVCNVEEFASLPPSQIVPRLADRGEYIASESSFYRILKAESMLHNRGKAKPRNSHKKPTSYTAIKANEVWSWDISYLSTTLIGQHYYLYMIEDIYSRQDIKDTKDLGVTTLVPKIDTSGAEKKGILNKSLFKYNQDKDVYICPADNELQYRYSTVEAGLDIKIYFNYMACKNCTIRHQCTRAKKDPRRIRRWVHEIDMEKMEALLKATPDAMLQRKKTVEHPFGTIKLWAGASNLLTRGLKNVSTELNLHVLAYNLKRMLSILGTEKLMQELMVA